LLGLAVLAFLLLATFDNSLDNRVNALDLPPGQKVALQAEEVNLGANDILKGASSEDRVAIDHAVDQASISAFPLAMLVSAGMALTSAIAAARLIQGNRNYQPGKPGPHVSS
jgi:hypothetical protein